MNKTILAILSIIIVAIIFFSIIDSSQVDEKLVASKIQVSATYFIDEKIIKISYDDRSNMTNSVILEVEGLNPSFHKKYSTSSFIEDIPLSQPPQYGWKTLPVTFLIDHKEFDKILLKTEISPVGQPHSKVIYVKP